MIRSVCSSAFRALALSAATSLFFGTLTGCAGGNTSGSNQQQQTTNPAPAVSGVSPASVVAGAASQTITVTGSGFITSSVVSFNGLALATTYSSATSLQATLPSASLANGQTASVTVTNPAPGGGTSSALSFAVNAPTPLIASFSPNYILQGSGSVLLITGSGFEANSSVLLNGTAHATTFLSSTSLTLALSTTDTQTSGSIQVTVNNPGPGGSTSAASSLVVYPAPSITSLTPATVLAGAASLQLTVTGSNFNPMSVVQVDGVAQLTTFVSASSLQATVSAAALANSRTAAVTVHNGAPTAADSASSSLQVMTPLPVLTALSPASVASGQAVTITLGGSGFTVASSVLWNGSARTTTYVSASSLRVALTAADVQTAGTGQLTVSNPAPGGGASAPLTLTIVTPPVITSLSPTSIQANTIYNSTVTVPLTINGTNFASGAYVTVGGYRFTPTSLSSTQIVVALTTSVLYFTGPSSVYVYNPGAGTTYFASQPATLNIINPSATFTVTPSSAPVGSPSVTISISGGAFFADSVVQWNGTPLATKSLGSTSLTAVIPATLLTTLGSATISVLTPENLGQSTPTQTFSTYVNLALNDMAWNPVDGLIYGTVSGVAGPGVGNSLVGIDPNTGAVVKTIFVGSEPNHLAISTDGTQAYVGIDGAGSFRQVNLTTSVAGTQVLLGGGLGTYVPVTTAASLAAVPGQPNSVALYTSNGVVSIYDSGVPRAKTGGAATYFGSSSGSLSFGSSASTLYLNNGALTAFTVDATGISATTKLNASAVSPNSGYLYTIQYDNKRLYVPTGSVADAATGNVVGQFSVPSTYSTTPVAAAGPTVSDSALNRAFVLVGNSSAVSGLYVFDETTFNLLGSVPNTTSSNSNYTSSGIGLIRWGQNGLAYRVGGQLYIVQSALVKDLSGAPADISVSAQAPATATTGSSFVTTFMVSNGGPNAASGVTLVFAFPSTVIPGQVTTSQGSCSGTGTVFCNLGGLGSGNSVTVTVNGTPTATGALQITATSASQSFDPSTNNNQATANTTVTGSGYSFVPVVSAISPNAAAMGAASYTLTVTGTGFAANSVVNWNGTALPTTYVSSTGLTAQIDASLVKTLGWSNVSVTNPAPGGGSSNMVTETIYNLVSLPANAMVYDPFQRKLWTVLPSTSTTPVGNSLVSLDPLTGSLGTPVAVGSEPNVLTETTSGNYLFLGISGAKSLGRYNLVTGRLDATVPLLQTSYAGPYAVAANAVTTIPGTDTSVAVPNVGILDFTGSAATIRANSALGYADAVFTDSSHAYTFDNTDTGFLFYRYTVDASGTHQVDGTTLAGMGGFQGSFAIENGIGYGAAGGIFNPATTPTSQIAVIQLTPPGASSSIYLYGGGVVPYSAEGKSFNIATSGLVYSERLDTQRFVYEDRIQLPTGTYAPQTVTGTRWGQDGLAYLITSGLGSSTPSQIMILRGPFVLPAEASTNSAPSLTAVGGNSVGVNSGNQRLTVTGTGFLPGASIVWNGLVHDTTYIDNRTLSVAVGAAELTSAATVTVTCRNPGSADSNVVNLSIH